MKRLFTIMAAASLSQALLTTAAQAQTNIYVVRNTKPEKTSIVTSVDRIDYADSKAQLFSGEKVTEFDVTAVKQMGIKEKDQTRKTVIPQSFLPDFDYDIAFSEADATLAGNVETEVTDTLVNTYDDFVAHSTFDKTLAISYGGATATVSGTVEGVEVTVTGNHVVVNSTVKGLHITLSGSASDGSFKLYATNKTCVTLDGVTLHNPKGPALNSQSKKRLFLVLADGTTNTLTDGDTYTKVTGEDQRGCVFAEGKLCISGAGRLTVVGNKKNGIASDDYVHILSGFVKVTTSQEKGTGVKSKDDFFMGGGALQVLAQGLAAKAVASDSLMHISGGKLTAITTGDGLWNEEEQDYSTACCLKADRVMTLTGGDLHLLATGRGGKGLRAGSDYAKGNELLVDGATIHVITSGDLMPEGATENDKVKSSPKGVKGSYDIEIKSGAIYVRCAGGYGGEGIESKRDLNISGGIIRTYCYDDGVNAVNSKINGGDIFVCSTDNDGYDCNGGLYINGGSLFAIGAPGDQAGIDNDGKTFGMNGGRVVGMGGYMSTPWDSKSKQATVLAFFKKDVAYVALTDADGKCLMAVKTPEGYNPYALMFSSSSIEVGKTYRLVSFSHLTGGTENEGIIENATYDDGTVEYEFTPEKLLTTLGSRK